MTYRQEMRNAIRREASAALAENPEIDFDKFLERCINRGLFPSHWTPEECGEVIYECLSATKYATIVDCR